MINYKIIPAKLTLLSYGVEYSPYLADLELLPRMQFPPPQHSSPHLPASFTSQKPFIAHETCKESYHTKAQ
jgi:hypothetical protein